jgi:hypothetical protein
MKRWGLPEAAVNTLVEEGRLMVTQKGGARGFSEDEVVSFEQSEDGKAFLKAHGATVGGGDAEALLDLDQGSGKEAVGDELFDFDTDLMAEPGAEKEKQKPKGKEKVPAKEAPKAAAKEAPKAKEKGKPKPKGDEETVAVTRGEETEVMPEEEISESDMITEVVDVSGLEAGEEDILGDIIEDVGAGEDEPQGAAGLERESTGSLGGEETMDMDSGGDATSEITELEEETLESDIGEGDVEATGDITQLEEESFEGEELEDILAGEEELHAQAEQGGEEAPFEEVEAYGPVATQAEPPVALWILVVLALVIVVQVVGMLFVVENAVRPEYSTKITEWLNLFHGQIGQN